MTWAPIGQKHIGKGAPVLVEAECLKRDFLPEGEIRGGMLGALPERLALVMAVDAVETDGFRVLVVQDFEGIAFEDGDDGAGVSHTLKRLERSLRD